MADRTLTALYDSKDAAHDAERRLKDAGIPDHDIKITSQDQQGGDHKGLWENIKSMFDPNDDDRHAYSEGLSRGGYLLTAKVADAHTDQAIEVLENSHAIDFDQRQEEWRTQGWNPTTAGAGVPQSALLRTTEGHTGSEPLVDQTGVGRGETAYDAGASSVGAAPVGYTGSATATGDLREGETLKLAEERLRVGKREVERGGVRVRSYVVETPVTEQVSLREEHVNIERRPTEERVATAGEDLFRERTLEVRETAEEAVVAKEAFVREELVVNKDVGQRTEIIKDTVRRTEVDVDDTRTGSSTGGLAGSESRSFATDTGYADDATLAPEERERLRLLREQAPTGRVDPAI